MCLRRNLDIYPTFGHRPDTTGDRAVPEPAAPATQEAMVRLIRSAICSGGVFGVKWVT